VPRLLEWAQDHGHGEVRGEEDDHEDGGGETGFVVNEAGGEDRKRYEPAASARYDGADLRDDVQELIDAMAQKGLVVDAAA
jgi:hypothetical protein